MIELSLIVRASIVLVLALVVVRTARRAAAARRALILALTFGLLLTLPVAAIVVPPLTVALPIAPRPSPAHALVSVATPLTATPVNTMAAVPATRRAHTTPAAVSLSVFVRAVWFVGAVLLALPLLVTLRNAARLRRDAAIYPAGERLAVTLALESDVRRPFDVRVHPSLDAPMTSGFVRATIYLPADAAQWRRDDLTRALTHELEHVRRADWLILLLARLVAALYWFHPLVWVAWRRLRLEIERACDDGVLQRADRTAYAEQLVALARRLSSSAPPPLAPMARRSDLGTRVAAVLDPDLPRGRVGRTAARISVGSALVLLLLVASPRITASPAQRPESQPVRTPQTTATRGTLTGIVYDPLGTPVEGMDVSIESGPFGPGVVDATRTDKAGRYTFDRLPPGLYFISAPVDFAPTISISVEEGQRVEQDIRMKVDGVAAIYSVCIDCEPMRPRYTPPPSMVLEFARDREAAAAQSSTAAEPLVGWDFYEPDVYVTDVIRNRQLTGNVVLEGRIDIDGAVSALTVASSSHPELDAAAVAAMKGERWRPATVHGVAVAVPLRLTIEFRHRGTRR